MPAWVIHVPTAPPTSVRLVGMLARNGIVLFFVLLIALLFLPPAPEVRRIAYIGLAVAWFLIVGGIALSAFGNLALKRLIEDLPTSTLRGAAQGYVEIQAEVRAADRTLTCQTCGCECLWFQCGRESFNPRAAPDILLDDGTGTCLLRPEGAFIWSPDEPPGHTHLRPGDRVIVLGELRAGGAREQGVALADPPRNRREAVAGALMRLKQDRTRMAALDVNRDGHVDQGEWAVARRAVESVAARGDIASPATAPPTDVLGAAANDPDGRRPFLIVVGSEEQAIAAARASGFVRVAIGTAAGFFGVVWLGLLSGVPQSLVGVAFIGMFVVFGALLFAFRDRAERVR
jgi:hypothetical protein